VLSASSSLARAGAWLDRAAFKPKTLPDDLVTGLALLPPVVAGLLIFKLPALEMLGVAVAAGLVGIVVARLLWRHERVRVGASPLLAAVVGVALVGAGASLVVSGEIAAVAVVLEVLRARFANAIRAQAGLIAYAGVALATRGAPSAYINPASGTPFTDPIATWYQFFSPASAPIDSIRLYVGNVPGPVFATSMLAVAIGIAWLAYARRLSLALLFAFLAGGLLAVNTLHWDVLFQLDSGPTWFVAGLVLADRRLLPDAWAVRPILGFAAGLFAIGLRRPPQGAWLSGHGIEVAFFTVAVVQAVMAVIIVVVWSASVAIERWKRTRRLRQREANLRVVNSAPPAS
jgi:Na+-transporting NADH:ubiquinone oxidoreductase subunit NqrB